MARMLLKLAFLPLGSGTAERLMSRGAFANGSGDDGMLKLSLFARLEAKPGKEDDVAAFLKQGLELANSETTTPLWLRCGSGRPLSLSLTPSVTKPEGRTT